jgi:peptide/nickel transport system permease protein
VTQLGIEVAHEMAGERIRRGESLTRRSLRRLLRRRIAVVCITIITLFYVVGVFAPLLAPSSFAKQNLDHTFEGPSISHPLGTDRLGRDALSRNIYAARTTTIVTAATVATGFVLSISCFN